MTFFSKEYWDAWLQKFGSFLVSVKMITIVGSTTIAVCIYQWLETLLCKGKITGAQFVSLVDTDLKYWAAILGIIIGARGAIQIADVIKQKINNVIPSSPPQEEADED